MSPACVLLVAGTLAAWPAGSCRAAEAVNPADLDKALERAGRALDKAADVVGGRDPGRVSLLLRRADDELQRFETDSRLGELVHTFDAARGAARDGRMGEAQAAIQGARALVPRLHDYVVVRQAELGGRLAQRAAAAGDADACLKALDTYESAILPAVLLRRVDDARAAVRAARDAMVRRDMKGGRTEIAAARAALDGLRYAGALSRALFALRIGAELTRRSAMIAAREQVGNAVRDLRTAAAAAPGPERQDLDRAQGRAQEVWKRMTRPVEGDAAILEELATRVEAIRARQS